MVDNSRVEKSKKFVMKINTNSKTKQMSNTIPRKALPSTLKFSKDLFVELRVFRMKK